MNIPMPNEVQPVSFLEYANQFADFDSRKQQQRLIDMKMQQMPQEQARRDRLSDANIDSMETEGIADKHKLAIQISSGIYNAMQQSGIQENDPAFQQQLEQVSRPLRPILSKVFGVPDDPTKPTDWNGIKSLAMAGQQQDNGYHPPAMTDKGALMYSGGAWKPIEINGQVAMPAAQSPELQAAVTNAREGQKVQKTQNADLTYSYPTNQQVNPQAFPIQPQGKKPNFQELVDLANNGDPQSLYDAREIMRKASAGDKDAIAAIEGAAQAQPPSYGPTAEQKTAQELDKYRKEKEIDAQTPNPLNDAQQYALDEKKDKAQAAKEDAIFSIKESIKGIDRLADIQKKTTTGPLTSNPVSATIRKAGSELGLDSVTGGKNLARLEKGYAEEAVKAIGAFKSIGVTFGALSNAEGNWVKETQAKIDSDGEVNLEMLAKGRALLQNKLDMLEKRNATSGPDYSIMPLEELIKHAKEAK